MAFTEQSFGLSISDARSLGPFLGGGGNVTDENDFADCKLMRLRYFGM